MGRKLKYPTEESYKAAIDTYFAELPEKKIANKAGLCVALGISRDTYNEYRDRYPDTHKGMELELEDVWIQRLAGTTPTGAIFYLKNAFKEEYKDRHENDNIHKFDKLALDDIRSLLAVMPQEEQDKYYDLLARLTAAAASVRSSPQN